MRRNSLHVRVGTAVLLVACTAAAAEAVDVKRMMGDFGISADAAARIRSGEMVESDPKESSERELAVGLTFLVQQPIANVLEAFRSTADMKADHQLLASGEAASLLNNYTPQLWQLLRSYPRGKPAELEERFYLLRYNLDGRPNYTLRHRMALPFSGGVALVDRDFYVGHGYNTSQAISGLIPVPEGTLVFYRNRVSTDQVGGFGSSVKRTFGRSVMAKQLTEIFARSRASFEPVQMSPVPIGKDTGLLR